MRSQGPRLYVAAFTLIFPAVLAAAPTATPDEQEEDKELMELLKQRDQVILDLLRRVEALEGEVQGLRSAAPAATASDRPERTNLSPEPPRAGEYDQEERLAQAALERTLISKGSLLLPPWTLEFEQSFNYYNSSSDLISIDGFAIFPVLVVGDIVSERVRRDIMVTALTTRLGLPGDFQFDVRVPLGYERERTVSADEREEKRSILALGDVEFGLTRQLFRERGARPDLLAGIRWKTTTGPDPFALASTTPAPGTGFHSLQATLTAVKVRDPVVFFGGFSYTTNLSATKAVGRINPSNPWGFHLGMALALNLESSLSFGWDQRFAGRTTLEGTPVPGSFLSEGTFRIGSSYVLAPGRSVDINLGIGLTRDVPDFQLSFAVPFRWFLHSPEPPLAARTGSSAAPATPR